MEGNFKTFVKNVTNPLPGATDFTQYQRIAWWPKNSTFVINNERTLSKIYTSEKCQRICHGKLEV